jgi:glycosyltransferase involved in cell wall biosynthesis
VQKAYRRDSEVVYPPVEMEELLELEPKSGDYFIYFGRLEKYKRVDMAIRACIAAGEKLTIVGTGSYEDELKELAVSLNGNELVTFTGWVPREEMIEMIAEAKAFVFPGPDEDFGIVLVESLAAGTPVIAFDAGGAGEILADGRTGVLLKEFDQEVLNNAVADFDADAYSSEDCRDRAKEFDVPVFKKRLTQLIENHL